MGVGHVSGATGDGDEELLAALADVVPVAFPDGQLDPAALLKALGVESKERPSFSFSWPGIDGARAEARAATTATLVPDEEASRNWDDARDVIIEGDNLQVLKLLKSGYSNQVKLIYIDPPYNTGESFTYRDDFAIPESAYLRATGQLDEHGNATTSRIENQGRKHAPWLNMMFPRLVLARHLLSRDGVMAVSIDNNEAHHLRLLMDAVFGATNFVDMMTWQGARKGDGKLTAGGQDYILIYARDLAHLKENDTRWRVKKDGLEEVYAKVDELRAEYGVDYQSASAALREWYRSLPEGHPSKAHDYYNNIDEHGVWFSDNISSPNYRENLVYDWKGYSPPDNGWRYERKTMERLDGEGRLIYPEDTTKRVKIKSYLHMREQWAPASVFYKDRRTASKALESLMGAKVFDNPKDVDVLAHLIQAITTGDDIVLDFFAGAASTAHAVWKQNAVDGQQRRWVMVQAPEPPDESEPSGKAALKAGYLTIFELAAGRLGKAAEAIEAKEDDSASLGFRVFRSATTNLKIEPPLIAEEGMKGDEYVQASLERSRAAPVLDGADPAAVAWEVVLKSTGTQLNAKVEVHNLGGIRVYEYRPRTETDGAGRLFVCLEEFELANADKLGLSDADTLILRGDQVDDGTTLTLAPRLQSRLVLLERVPREVTL